MTNASNAWSIIPVTGYRRRYRSRYGCLSRVASRIRRFAGAFLHGSWPAVDIRRPFADDPRRGTAWQFPRAARHRSGPARTGHRQVHVPHGSSCVSWPCIRDTGSRGIEPGSPVPRTRTAARPSRIRSCSRTRRNCGWYRNKRGRAASRTAHARQDFRSARSLHGKQKTGHLYSYWQSLASFLTSDLRLSLNLSPDVAV